MRVFKPTGNPPLKRSEEDADAITSLDDIEDAFGRHNPLVNDRIEAS